MLSAPHEADRRQVVGLLWLYFALLIVEGALRKWVVPEFSDALLIVRDPVAALIVYYGIRDGMMPETALMRAFAWLLVAFTAVGSVQMVTVGLPPTILAFGLRTYFLHPPVLFIMARALNRRDLRQFLLATLVLAVPIAWLMAQQFNAGPLDWINRGAGEGRLQIVSSSGRIRPSGPFSFISGPVFYFSLALACLAAAHMRRMAVPLVVLAAGWGALLVAVAVSGSRSLLAGLIPVALAIAFAMVRRPTLISGFVRGAVIAAAIVVSIWGSTVVQEGLEVLDTRFEEAGGRQEVVQRSSDMYLMTSIAWSDAPLLGLGIGMGTNAANALLGAAVFRFGENEWTRVLFEAGPVLGCAYLLWRVLLVISLLRAANTVLAAGEVLPLLLAAAVLTNLLLGPWGQPTTQGFAVWTAGLAFAACRVRVTQSARAGRRRARRTPVAVPAPAAVAVPGATPPPWAPPSF